MLSFDPSMIQAVMERFAPSQALAPLERLPSAPDIAFGLVVEGQVDEEAEQAALLYSTERAGDRYRLVSLGAAPGEWAIKAERAYRWKRPSGDFRSYCIEGDLDHVTMINDFLEINGANRDLHDVRYAVVAEKDGVARFPIINAVADWGAGIAGLADRAEDLDANMTITAKAVADRIGANGGKPIEYREVEAISLQTLLATTGVVDFLHCDIQAAEETVFPPQMEALGQFVRVACISIHSEAIGAKLRDVFAFNGWTLQADFACGINEYGDVGRDGVMIFFNPRLA